MKTADEHLGSVDKSIERAQRNAFLNSKGIKPNSQFQLDLIFPDTIGDRDDLRHIPNDYALDRSLRPGTSASPGER